MRRGWRSLSLVVVAGWLAVACGDNLGSRADDAADAATDGPVTACGDGEIDRGAGEECEGGLECSGECRLLPCETPSPCVIAERDDTGTCVSRPAADGTSCENGDPCTTADACLAGACVGEASGPRTPGMRGQVTSFGAAAPLDTSMEGVASFIADDRLVFLESTTLTESSLSLVEVGEAGLTRVATGTSALAYAFHIDWIYRPMTHIVALEDDRFAVVGGEAESSGFSSSIELFEIDGSSLESRGVTSMEMTRPVFGVATRPGVLWVCDSGAIRTYLYDSAAETFTLAGEIPTACRTIALSADGQTLYSGEQVTLGLGGGLLAFDVSTHPAPKHATNVSVPDICPAGTVTSSCRLFAATSIHQVQVSEDYLAVLDFNGFGEPGDLTVMSPTDAADSRVIEPPATGATAVAFALTGSRLFVEWFINDPASLWPSVSVAVHPLDAGSTTPLAELAFRDECCGRDAFTLLAFGARGDLAALQPWRQVVRFDEPDASLSFVTGIEHGSLDGVFPVSVGEVATVGPFSRHRIDVSVPDAPVFVSGGLDLGFAESDLQLVREWPGSPFRRVHINQNAFSPLRQINEHELFSLYDGPAATSVGTFWIAGERDGMTHLAATGGDIFQVRPVGTGADPDVRVRRFHASRGIGLDKQELVPDLEVTLDAPPVAGRPSWYFSAAGANASGDELVLVESFAGSGFVTRVTWLAVGTDSLSVLARTEIAGVPDGTTAVVVAGDQAMLTALNTVARLRRVGDTVALEATRELVATAELANPLFGQTVRFDGDQVLVTSHRFHMPEIRSQWAIELLDAATLVPLFTYDTPEEVHSVTVAGGQFVFGMNSTVSVADPLCE